MNSQNYLSLHQHSTPTRRYYQVPDMDTTFALGSPDPNFVGRDGVPSQSPAGLQTVEQQLYRLCRRVSRNGPRSQSRRSLYPWIWLQKLSSSPERLRRQIVPPLHASHRARAGGGGRLPAGWGWPAGRVDPATAAPRTARCIRRAGGGARKLMTKSSPSLISESKARPCNASGGQVVCV